MTSTSPGAQRGDVLHHRASRDAIQPRWRNPRPAQIFLQAHPWRRHLADSRQPHTRQIAQPEIRPRRASYQQERIAGYDLGETDQIAAWDQLVGLHHPHRPAPADIDAAVEQSARRVAGPWCGDETNLHPGRRVSVLRKRHVERRIEQSAQRFLQNDRHPRIPFGRRPHTLARSALSPVPHYRLTRRAGIEAPTTRACPGCETGGICLSLAATAPSSARRWVACIVLLAGGFLPPADFFIVNVTLSSIHETLHASPAQVQLVISGYAASYAVFLATAGRLGDLYGRRLMFLLGMAGFTVMSALCGLATSAWVLDVSRVGQGVMAALLVPQVLGAMPTLFDDERGLARAMSAYGLMMGLAAAIGQAGGGAIVAWSPFGLGWRGVFLMNLPICVIVLIIAWFVVPETSTSRRTKPDLGGIALLSLTLACLILPSVEGHELGWPAWTIGALFAVPFLLAAFLAWEARLSRVGGAPLFDLALLRIGSFRRGVIVASLFFFTAPFYLLFGLYEQEGRGIAPLFTGLAFLPYGIGFFAGSMASAPARARPASQVAHHRHGDRGRRLRRSGHRRGARMAALGGRRDGVHRRFRPGHRLAAPLQRRAEPHAGGQGGRRVRRDQYDAADWRLGRRGGDRQRVLYGTARRDRRAGLCACVRCRDDRGGRGADTGDAGDDAARLMGLRD